MTDSDCRAWIARAKALAWFSIVYNLLEALACAWFGAGDRSLSLLGFGADSLVEFASAGVVLWRFHGELAGQGSGSHAEHRAHRAIGALLLALTALLVLGAAAEWRAGRGPESGTAGMVISVVSLLCMAGLFAFKRRAALVLESPVLKADAFCTLSCMWLGGLLLLGSVLVAATRRPLADALTSLAMAGLIAREGWENWTESACDCD